MHQTILIIYLISVVFCQKLNAQYLYSAKHYTIHEGLNSDGVFSLGRDGYDRLWVATLNGIGYFNGIKWETYKPSYKLPKDIYTKFTKDQKGKLWLTGALEKGFFVGIVDADHQIRRMPINPAAALPGQFGIYGFEVSYKESDTLIHIGHSNVLLSYSLVSKELLYDSVPKIKKITKVLAYKNELLILGNKGVFLKTNSGFKEIHLNTNEEEAYFDAVNTEKETVILGSNYIYTISDDSIKKFDYGHTNKKIFKDYHIIKLSEKEFLFIKSGTLCKINTQTGQITQPNIANYSQNHPVTALLKTNQYIWMGTPNGVFQFNLAYKSYTSDNGIPGDEVSLVMDMGNNQVFLSCNNGLAIIENEKITYAVKKSEKLLTEFKEQRILDAVLEGKNIIMAASEAGFLSFDIKKKKITPLKLDTYYAFSSALHNDTLLLAFREKNYQNRLGYYKNGQIVKKISLPNGYVRKIKILHNNDIVVIGAGIACVLRKDTCIKLKMHDGSLPKIYDAVQYEPFGTLLASAEGIDILSNDSIVPTRLFGINSPIYAFLIDKENNLWMGTDNGLLCYDGQKIHQITRHEGLIGYDVSRKGLIQDKTGQIWVGTNQGITVFDPKIIKKEKENPNIYFTAIKSNNEPILDTTLEYSKNNLEFEFEAISFEPQERMNFRVKLHGYDQDWVQIENTNHKHIRYTSLPFGQYQLEIQYKFSFSDWQKGIKSSLITIKKPFYLKNWFLFLILIVVTFFIYQINNFFNKVRNEQRLKILLEEKTREIRLNERELEEKNLELTRVNKELDRFVYSASHDIKAPLASLKGIVQIIRNEELDPKIEPYIEYIEKNIIRLDVFIKELIDFSRNVRTEISVEQIDFYSLIQEAIEENKYYQKDNIQITTQIIANAVFFSDKRRISVVLNNLISNSIKYHNPYIDESHIKIIVEIDLQKALISIEDNGIGIKEEYIPRLFEMFFRATEQSSGSGLGLFIVKETLDKLGGKIEVSSLLNKGSIFRIKIPNLIGKG